MAAKRKGRYLKKGSQPIQIYWAAHTPRTGTTTHLVYSIHILMTFYTNCVHIIFSYITALHPGQKSPIASEVDDELASMAGTSDVSGEGLRILSRPGQRSTSSRPSATSQARPKEVEALKGMMKKRSVSPSEAQSSRAAPLSYKPPVPATSKPTDTGQLGHGHFRSTQIRKILVFMVLQLYVYFRIEPCIPQVTIRLYRTHS